LKTIYGPNPDFLKSAQAMYRVELITIDLLNGEHIYAVLGPGFDLSWGGQDYLIGAYGAWERGAITSVADFSLESKSFTLSLIANADILVPGTSSEIMSVVNSGFFDGAPIHIAVVYMPAQQWGSIQCWTYLFATPPSGDAGGMIVSAQKLGRSKAAFEVRDWNYLLNIKVPQRVIQPSCFHSLFDNGCALTQSSYAASRTVGTGSSQSVIVPSTAWPATDPNGRNPQSSTPPYYNQGKILFTSGQNKNLYASVISQAAGASGALTLNAPMMFPVAVGDTFQAFPGCSKTVTACKGFNNFVHFGGQPYVPPPEASA
jgi:Phage conserved hypothetical protein BR0599